MLNLSTSQVYQPVQNSRRSEIQAWILTFVLIVTIIFVPIESGMVKVGSFLMLGFFGLSAMVISLGNWIDRRTFLGMDENGIDFRNGLRNVQFMWEEVEKVQVHPSNAGDKVLILGNRSYFSFQTLGEIVRNNEEKGRIGFEKGEEILKTILHFSGLDNEQKQQDKSYYYYLRE
jgi:hypothetical protein